MISNGRTSALSKRTEAGGRTKCAFQTVRVRCGVACDVASDFVSIAVRNIDRRILTTPTNTQPPRVAASSYLNTAPLIWSFLYGPRRGTVRLVTDAAPAYCGDLLASQQVEAALVPIIEYQRMDGVMVVPDVCVGSHRAVRSVVLVSKEDDLKKVKRVALDESSRTSQALVKIIFREFIDSEPLWESSNPDITAMLERNDAALVIGDPAMRISSEAFHVFDLATLWRKFTDTGFVFAMWMARDTAAGSVREVDFAAARDEGLQRIDEIISNYETEVPLPKNEVKEYLTDNITFTVDENLEQGMRLYFELAHKYGLIDKLKPLQFIET